MVNIRQATASDAEQIAKVHVDSWKTTYQGIVPDSYLNTLTYNSRTQLWHKLIEEKSFDIYVAIDEKSDTIVAFIAFLINDKHEGHISALYALETYQGVGIGKKLLCKALTHFASHHCTTATVEVLEENKAKAFYLHYGAQLKERVTITIGGKTLSELILQWTSFNHLR